MKIGNSMNKLVNDYRKNIYLVLLFLPGIIYYFVFAYGPMYGIQIAFKNYIFRKGITGSPWVGLEHFQYMWGLESFWEVFRNTLIISVYKFAWGFPAPIILAILLNELRNQKFKKVVQTISYLPHFVSWVVLAGVFVQFLSPSSGPINIILKSFGLKPIFFLGDVKWFRSVLVGTSVWKGIGWGTIIYLAALSGIDPNIYEAADIDGASRFQKIMKITLPSLAPVVTIMLIFSIKGLVADDFDQIFNLYNEGVYSVGDVISTYTFRMGLEQMMYSFSTAVGLFKNLIAFALIWVANTIAKRINDYGIW